MDSDAQAAYALADENERLARRARLREPHVAPLTEFVDSLRATSGRGNDIPYFDPADGGVGAPLLFLLEAPGARAVASGFISRNNPDPSARNFLRFAAEAGLARDKTALWNIVPWYIGANGRIRAARPSDVREGARHLSGLLNRFTDLRAIVLVGRKAQQARDLIRDVASLPILETLHTSNQVVACWPDRRDQLRTEFANVARFLTDAERPLRSRNAS